MSHCFRVGPEVRGVNRGARGAAGRRKGRRKKGKRGKKEVICDSKNFGMAFFSHFRKVATLFSIRQSDFWNLEAIWNRNR